VYGTHLLLAASTDPVSLPDDPFRVSADVHLSDAYTFPIPSRLTDRPARLTGRIPVGTSVLITAACISHVTSHCGRGIIEMGHLYNIGDHLLVADTVNRICDAQVHDTRGDGMNEMIYIHYVGFSSRWDEWLPVTSSRIHRDGGITTARKGVHKPGEGVGLLTLANLVGRVGIITQVAHVTRSASSDIDASPTIRPKRSVDSMVRLFVPDPVVGTSITFWSRINLLQPYIHPTHRHVSLPALHTLSLSSLTSRAIDTEQMIIRKLAQIIVEGMLKGVKEHESVDSMLRCPSLSHPTIKNNTSRTVPTSASYDSLSAQSLPPSTSPARFLFLSPPLASLLSPSAAISTRFHEILTCLPVICQPKLHDTPYLGLYTQHITGGTGTGTGIDATATGTVAPSTAGMERSSTTAHQHQLQLLATLSRVMLLSSGMSSTPMLTVDHMKWMKSQFEIVSSNLLHDFTGEKATLQGCQVTTLSPHRFHRLSIDDVHVDSLLMLSLRVTNPRFDITIYDSRHLLTQLYHFHYISSKNDVLPPLLLPNPSWIRSQPSRQPADDGVDDVLTYIIIPFSNRTFEATLFFIQLCIHVQRDWKQYMPQPMSDTASVSESSVATRMLQDLLLQAYNMIRQYLLLLHRICPYPSHYKSRCYEIMAHLMLCLTTSNGDVQFNTSSTSNTSTSTSASTPLDTPLDLSWLHPFIREARGRYASELESAPLFSPYLQRLIEMLYIAYHIGRKQEGKKEDDNGDIKRANMDAEKHVQTSVNSVDSTAETSTSESTCPPTALPLP